MARFPSEKEALVLDLLSEHGRLYGLELVGLSAGRLKRGTVYVTLSRMVDKGLILASDDRQPEGHAGMPRPRYRIAAGGERALAALSAMQGAWRVARRTV
jgi:PadR family transcriptional regulator, regulatory protein PadR